MVHSSVLVLGAGELGRAILQALVSHPSRADTSIHVLLRPASIESESQQKKQEIARLRALGIEIIAGDVAEDNEQQLRSILTRYDTVINATGMYAPSGTQTRICRAVLSSRCRRYFPWQFGVDYDLIGPSSSQRLFTEQLSVREMLRGQTETAWVIVSTGMFTSFLFEPAFCLVNAERDTVTAIGSWENRITVTSPQDIGLITAELALVDTEVQGVVYTAGDTVSMESFADLVEHLSNAQVKRLLKTVPQLRKELADDPEDSMKMYRVVFGEGIGVSWDKEGTYNARQGIATETAEEWARKYLKVPA